jgi:hypothetical protein
MRKQIILLATFSLLLGVSSCDKDFKEINTNPVLPTSLDPGYLFSNAQLNTATSTLPYHMQIVQQIVTPFTGVLEAGNHNVINDNNTSPLFNNYFVGTAGNSAAPVRLLVSVIEQTKDNAARSNLYNMARIWKAFLFQVLVDTYGDVPYSEAGGAYISAINLPKYDDQETIYEDLLKEVSEATQALDAAKAIESGDLFYKGNIAQWKKLGNSLLLRIAMRYTKIDENKAEQYVAIATNPANGGVMASNADNAYITFNNDYNHPNANSFQGTERANFYLGRPFVDYLKATQDPRLPWIGAKYTNPSGSTVAAAEPADTISANQIGMPFGYKDATIVNEPLYPGKVGAAFKYTQLNRRVVAKITSPEFFITHAQTQLLLAEAAFRGYISGDPATYYAEGVRAHMNQLQQFDASAVISADLQNGYLANNPYDPARALEVINTQYWIASFLNGPEVWANFRRSGYPVLQRNDYPEQDPDVKSSADGFIHRIVYPDREKSVNVDNYNAAAANIGGDKLTTRVFWDQ